jgi:hypothetical protein
VEPFFLRCETCHARLRVRDERFVGQVQSCPKCGSMVQILAPAGWLVTGAAAPAPDPAEVAFAAAPTAAARVATLLREHAVLWSTGAAVTLAASGLVAFLALRGGKEEVAALPPAAPAVETTVAEPSEGVQQELPPATEVETKVQTVESTLPAPMPRPQEEQEEIEVAVAEERPPADDLPAVIPEQPRTLTLEPVENEPHTAAASTAADAVPNYPPAIEAESGAADAKPQAARLPARVTNVVDQLALPIESIDLPAMPIGEFVNLVSGMAAVPIQLDVKVLGEVGLSTRSTVTVHGDHTTAGKLLASVLKEHRLTCVERDGVLVVVKSKR